MPSLTNAVPSLTNGAGMSTTSRAVVSVLVALAVIGLVAPAASALDVTVNATDDVVDMTGCDATHCSLREAVIAVNAAGAGSHQIRFASPGMVISLTTGEGGGLTETTDPPQTTLGDATVNDLDLTGGATVVTVLGDDTTISADFAVDNAETRIFDGLAQEVHLSDLTLVGGSAAGGGAIRMVAGTFDVSATTIRGNDGGDLGGGVLAHPINAFQVLDGTVIEGNAAGLRGGGLFVEPLAGNAAVRILESTVRGNTAGVGLPNTSQGGGLYLAEDGFAVAQLTVSDSLLEDNVATSTEAADATRGGAIAGSVSEVDIGQSAVTGNGDGPGDDDTSEGGAIAVNGDVTITDSLFEGNVATTEGGVMRVSTQTVTILRSTFTGNAVTGIDVEGGSVGGDALGGAFSSGEGTFDIATSTFTANTSRDGGSALDLSSADATIDQSTFSDNGPAVAGTDSAQLYVGQFSFLDIASTIIANPVTVPSCVSDAPAITTPVTSAGGNLEDADTCGFVDGTDQTGADPLLGALADNGGTTIGPGGTTPLTTMAITSASPAHDRGLTGASPAGPACGTAPRDTDERGLPRPSGGGCDVGAFELQEISTPPPPPPPVADVSVSKAADQAVVTVGDTVTYTVTVRNDGPRTAANVELTDTLPADARVTSDVTADGCTEASGTISCPLGTMPSGTEAGFSYDVVHDTAGTKVNTASATTTTTDPDTDDRTASATVEVEADVTQIGGPTRVETAAGGSQAFFPAGSAGAAVLTRADLFPDAQAGIPLAILNDAPILPTPPTELHPEVEAELGRVLPAGGTVFLLGGLEALSQDVEDRVTDLGYAVVRLGGANRFETAAIIAAEGLGDPDTFLVADGGTFTDTILAGTATLPLSDGGTVEAGVLLTSDGAVPPETAAYLDGLASPPTLLAVGDLAALAVPDVEHVTGADPFDLSVQVAQRFFDAPARIGVATAADFSDALVAGALLGHGDDAPSPLLFSTRDALPAPVEAYLVDVAGSLSAAVVFGGPAAISEAVVARLEEIING